MLDYMPVRFAQNEHGETVVIEISHRQDEAHGWAPTSWTNTRMKKKREIIVSDAETVTRFTINEDIPRSDFNVELPAGTYVSDSIANESFIVLSNHERRLILRGEFNGKNYEQVLHSESGSLLPRASRSWLWLVSASVALILALTAAA